MLYQPKKTYKKRTHCRHGHEYTPESTATVNLKSGYTVRRCKTCRKQADKERYMDKPDYAARKRARAAQQYLEQCAELYS